MRWKHSESTASSRDFISQSGGFSVATLGEAMDTTLSHKPMLQSAKTTSQHTTTAKTTQKTT
jgi:hypothetical protein